MAALAILRFAEQPLTHRGFGGEEHAPDRVRRKVRDHLQCQRDAGLHRQGGVATREHESQAIVVDRLPVDGRFVTRIVVHGDLAELAAFGLATAEDVDGTPSGGGRQPGRGTVGNAVVDPAKQRAFGSIGDSVLGEIPVTSCTDQGGDDAETLVGESIGECATDVARRAPTVGHDVGPPGSSSSQNGRSSRRPNRAIGC